MNIKNFQNRGIILFVIVLFIGLGSLSCEGPMGPQGPRGEQGPPGPVGPAGSDGSIIHAGEGALRESTGNPGDFYLDLTTGNLFGPKMAEGWGAPFNLIGDEGPQGPAGPQGPQGPSGEDGQDGKNGQDGDQGPQGPPGQDGEDGQDGPDGEDGSQIFTGNGAPDGQLGNEGDYYLDKVNYDLYGPKTGSGWAAPVNLQGDPGTANVIYSDWFDIEWNGADENLYKRMNIIEPFVDEDFINTGTAQMYLLHNSGHVSALPFSSADLTFAFFLRPENFSHPTMPGMFPNEPGLSFYFQNTTGNLVLFGFDKVRYVLIPGGVSAGKMHENFWKDYDKVAAYFGIPN